MSAVRALAPSEHARDQKAARAAGRGQLTLLLRVTQTVQFGRWNDTHTAAARSVTGIHLVSHSTCHQPPGICFWLYNVSLRPGGGGGGGGGGGWGGHTCQFFFRACNENRRRNATKLYFMIHRFCIVCEVFLPQVT